MTSYEDYVAETPKQAAELFSLDLLDDWEQVKFQRKQLAESSRGQNEINSRIQTRINELIRLVNHIAKEDNADRAEAIIARNRIIITDLQDLILALTLAKIKDLPEPYAPKNQP